MQVVEIIRILLYKKNEAQFKATQKARYHLYLCEYAGAW